MASTDQSQHHVTSSPQDGGGHLENHQDYYNDENKMAALSPRDDEMGTDLDASYEAEEGFNGNEEPEVKDHHEIVSAKGGGGGDDPSELKDRGSEKDQDSGSAGGDSPRRQKTKAAKERENQEKESHPRPGSGSASPIKDPAKYREREERLKQARERREAEQAKKLEELRETQRKAQEFRERQERERRRKMHDLKKRDEEHRHAMEERKRRLETEERTRKEALLKKLSERDQKLDQLRSRKGAGSAYAFGSSTERMHNSYLLDVSKRAQSQGCLMGPPPSSSFSSTTTSSTTPAPGTVPGVGHGGEVPGSNTGGPGLRAGRRATSSLSLTRRSHQDKTGLSNQSARRSAPHNTSLNTSLARRAVSTTQLANQNKRHKADPSMSGPPGATSSMANLSTGRSKSNHSDAATLSSDGSPRHPPQSSRSRPHSVGPSAHRSALLSPTGEGGVATISSSSLPSYAAPTVSSKIRTSRSRQRLLEPSCCDVRTPAAAGGKHMDDDVDDSQPVCYRFRSHSAPPGKMRKAAAEARRNRGDLERSMQRLSTPRKQVGPPPEPMSVGAPARKSSPKPNAKPTKAANATPAPPPKIILPKATPADLKPKSAPKKDAVPMNKGPMRAVHKPNTAPLKSSNVQKPSPALQNKAQSKSNDASATKKEAQARKPPIPKAPRSSSKDTSKAKATSTSAEKVEKKPLPIRKARAAAASGKTAAVKDNKKDKKDNNKDTAKPSAPSADMDEVQDAEPKMPSAEAENEALAEKEATADEDQISNASEPSIETPAPNEDMDTSVTKDEDPEKENVEPGAENAMDTSTGKEKGDEEKEVTAESSVPDAERKEETLEHDSLTEAQSHADSEVQPITADNEQPKAAAESTTSDEPAANIEKEPAGDIVAENADSQVPVEEEMPTENVSVETKDTPADSQAAAADQTAADQTAVDQTAAPETVEESKAMPKSESSDSLKAGRSTPDTPKHAQVDSLKGTPKKEKSRSRQSTAGNKNDGDAKGTKQLAAEEAKAKLAERRREAREKAQREAEEKARREAEEKRLEEERLAREAEEERLAELEQIRLMEEARAAEAERLQRAIEENERRMAEEEAKLEEERKQKEEEERLRKEELEKKERELADKARKEEEERLARKKRLEMIMARTRAKGDTSSSSSQSASPTKSPAGGATPSDENAASTFVAANEAAPAQEPVKEESPEPAVQIEEARDQRSPSPEKLDKPEGEIQEKDDTPEPPQPAPVSNLISEDSATPKFKSPILQQMLGKGRLKLSTDNLAREASGSNSSSTEVSQRNSPDSTRQSLADGLDVVGSEDSSYDTAAAQPAPPQQQHEVSSRASEDLARADEVQDGGDVLSEQEVSEMPQNDQTIENTTSAVLAQNESETAPQPQQQQNETVSLDQVQLLDFSDNNDQIVQHESIGNQLESSSKDLLADFNATTPSQELNGATKGLDRDTSSAAGTENGARTNGEAPNTPTAPKEALLELDFGAVNGASNGAKDVNGAGSHPQSPEATSDVEMAENGHSTAERPEDQQLISLDNTPLDNASTKLANLQSSHDVINSNMAPASTQLIGLDDNEALARTNSRNSESDHSALEMGLCKNSGVEQIPESHSLTDNQYQTSQHQISLENFHNFQDDSSRDISKFRPSDFDSLNSDINPTAIVSDTELDQNCESNIKPSESADKMETSVINTSDKPDPVICSSASRENMYLDLNSCMNGRQNDEQSDKEEQDNDAILDETDIMLDIPDEAESHENVQNYEEKMALLDESDITIDIQDGAESHENVQNYKEQQDNEAVLDESDITLDIQDGAESHENMQNYKDQQDNEAVVDEADITLDIQDGDKGKEVESSSETEVDENIADAANKADALSHSRTEGTDNQQESQEFQAVDHTFDDAALTETVDEIHSEIQNTHDDDDDKVLQEEKEMTNESTHDMESSQTDPNIIESVPDGDKYHQAQIETHLISDVTETEDEVQVKTSITNVEDTQSDMRSHIFSPARDDESSESDDSEGHYRPGKEEFTGGMPKQDEDDDDDFAGIRRLRRHATSPQLSLSSNKGDGDDKSSNRNNVDSSPVENKDDPYFSCNKEESSLNEKMTDNSSYEFNEETGEKVKTDENDEIVFSAVRKGDEVNSFELENVQATQIGGGDHEDVTEFRENAHVSKESTEIHQEEKVPTTHLEHRSDIDEDQESESEHVESVIEERPHLEHTDDEASIEENFEFIEKDDIPDIECTEQREKDVLDKGTEESEKTGMNRFDDIKDPGMQTSKEFEPESSRFSPPSHEKEGGHISTTSHFAGDEENDAFSTKSVDSDDENSSEISRRASDIIESVLSTVIQEHPGSNADDERESLEKVPDICVEKDNTQDHDAIEKGVVFQHGQALEDKSEEQESPKKGPDIYVENDNIQDNAAMGESFLPQRNQELENQRDDKENDVITDMHAPALHFIPSHAPRECFTSMGDSMYVHTSGEEDESDPEIGAYSDNDATHDIDEMNAEYETHDTDDMNPADDFEEPTETQETVEQFDIRDNSEAEDSNVDFSYEEDRDETQEFNDSQEELMQDLAAYKPDKQKTVTEDLKHCRDLDEKQTDTDEQVERLESYVRHSGADDFEGKYPDVESDTGRSDLEHYEKAQDFKTRHLDFEVNEEKPDFSDFEHNKEAQAQDSRRSYNEETKGSDDIKNYEETQVSGDLKDVEETQDSYEPDIKNVDPDEQDFSSKQFEDHEETLDSYVTPSNFDDNEDTQSSHAEHLDEIRVSGAEHIDSTDCDGQRVVNVEQFDITYTNSEAEDSNVDLYEEDRDDVLDSDKPRRDFAGENVDPQNLSVIHEDMMVPQEDDEVQSQHPDRVETHERNTEEGGALSDAIQAPVDQNEEQTLNFIETEKDLHEDKNEDQYFDDKPSDIEKNAEITETDVKLSDFEHHEETHEKRVDFEPDMEMNVENKVEQDDQSFVEAEINLHGDENGAQISDGKHSDENNEITESDFGLHEDTHEKHENDEPAKEMNLERKDSTTTHSDQAQTDDHEETDEKQINDEPDNEINVVQTDDPSSAEEASQRRASHGDTDEYPDTASSDYDSDYAHKHFTGTATQSTSSVQREQHQQRVAAAKKNNGALKKRGFIATLRHAMLGDSTDSECKEEPSANIADFESTTSVESRGRRIDPLKKSTNRPTARAAKSRDPDEASSSDDENYDPDEHLPEFNEPTLADSDGITLDQPDDEDISRVASKNQDNVRTLESPPVVHKRKYEDMRTDSEDDNANQSYSSNEQFRAATHQLLQDSATSFNRSLSNTPSESDGNSNPIDEKSLTFSHRSFEVSTNDSNSNPTILSDTNLVRESTTCSEASLSNSHVGDEEIGSLRQGVGCQLEGVVPGIEHTEEFGYDTVVRRRGEDYLVSAEKAEM